MGGEEVPGNMHGGTCYLWENGHTLGKRTYEEQRRYQSLEGRSNAIKGALFMVYGAVGAGLVWRGTRVRPERE